MNDLLTNLGIYSSYKMIGFISAGDQLNNQMTLTSPFNFVVDFIAAFCECATRANPHFCPTNERSTY